MARSVFISCKNGHHEYYSIPPEAFIAVKGVRRGDSSFYAESCKEMQGKIFPEEFISYVLPLQDRTLFEKDSERRVGDVKREITENINLPFLGAKLVEIWGYKGYVVRIPYLAEFVLICSCDMEKKEMTVRWHSFIDKEKRIVMTSGRDYISYVVNSERAFMEDRCYSIWKIFTTVPMHIPSDDERKAEIMEQMYKSSDAVGLCNYAGGYQVHEFAIHGGCPRGSKMNVYIVSRGPSLSYSGRGAHSCLGDVILGKTFDINRVDDRVDITIKTNRWLPLWGISYLTHEGEGGKEIRICGPFIDEAVSDYRLFRVINNYNDRQHLIIAVVADHSIFINDAYLEKMQSRFDPYCSEWIAPTASWKPRPPIGTI